VLFACHHDMVQAFPADRADQALRIPVLPRRACRRWMIVNAERVNATNEYAAVASIVCAENLIHVDEMRESPKLTRWLHFYALCLRSWPRR